MLSATLAAGAALLVLVGGVWLGWLAMGRPTAHRPASDLLVAAWIGWFLQGMVVLAIGWAGFLSPVGLGLLLLAPLGAVFLDRHAFGGWVGEALRDYRQLASAPWWARLIAALALGWLLLQLTSPPFHYDLLTYGFGQPMHWLAEGRIGPVGPDAYAYEAVPSRMHFVWSLGLLGAPMAAALLLGWTVAAALLLARTLRRVLGDGPWPLLGASAVLLTPAVWDLLLLRKDDLSALWGGAALLLLVVSWHGPSARDATASSRRPAEWVTLGLAAAATVAAKPGVTAGYVGAVLLAAWLECDGPARRRLMVGAALGAVMLLALAPIALHTWAGMGHPLAAALPYLGHYELASTRWEKALDDAYPWSPQPLARLFPYALLELGRFFDPGRWNFGDNLGLLVLFGVPLALVSTRFGRLRWIWLAGLAGWFFTFHWPRFTLVLLPLSVLLVFELLERLVAPRRVALLLVAVTAIHVAFFASLTVTGVTIFRPSVASAFGRNAELAFVPPSVAVCEFANRSLSRADHRILFVGETRSYPCAIPFDFWNGHFRHPFERLRRDEAPEIRWDRHVHERGATHLIYSPQVARKRMEWSPRMHARFERWLERRGRLLVALENRESTTRLYALTPRRSSSGAPAVADAKAAWR